MAHSKHSDVLILGAGAAGLAAARDLSHAGCRVTVVEARPRIGGRILTLHDPRSPLPLELGAEFIHGEAPETLSIAQAARLMVLELPDGHELATAGHFKPLRSFWEVVDKMNRDLARRLSRRGTDFPISEYLDDGAVPAVQRQMLRDFVQGFYAAHPERLSAQSLADEADVEGEENMLEKQFRIANGGDAVMQWLRDGLDPERTEVRLSTAAARVVWKRGAVTVECLGSDGELLAPLRARVCVITLPHAVLKAGIPRFDPALPAKQRALAGVETGQIFKIVLRFRHAFWEDGEFLKERRANGHKSSEGLNFLHANGAAIPTWWTTLPVHAPILTGWVGASAAESILAQPPEERIERSLVALSDVLAVPRRELEEQLDAWASHDWRADPFARGAYAYIAVGGMSAARSLGRPVDGTLFFAGEATSVDKIGTVAGALSSGRRAAKEVQRALG